MITPSVIQERISFRSIDVQTLPLILHSGSKAILKYFPLFVENLVTQGSVRVCASLRYFAVLLCLHFKRGLIGMYEMEMPRAAIV